MMICIFVDISLFVASAQQKKTKCIWMRATLIGQTLSPARYDEQHTHTQEMHTIYRI